MVLLVYRTAGDGLRIIMFETEDKAEAKAVKWVSADYPNCGIKTMDDIRKLEEIKLFAIDIITDFEICKEYAI